MKVIKKLNILSVAKISGILYGGVYLIAGLVINVAVLLFGIPSLKNLDILGFGSGILATFLVALLIGAISFVIGAVFAWFYNIAAKIVGGICWHEDIVADQNHLPKTKKEEPVKPQNEIDNILQEDNKKKKERETFSPDDSNSLSS